MSLKTIFSDSVDTTYIPILADDWNSTISNDPVYQYNLTMSQNGDNEYPLTITITQLFGGYNYIMCIHTGILSLSQLKTTANINYNWKSTTPINPRFYSTYAGIQLGYSSGAVFGQDGSVLRPCDFCWYIDTQGYLYVSQAYNDALTLTREWCQPYETNYSYAPSCSTTGDVTLGNAFQTGNLILTDTTFIVNTLVTLLSGRVVR